MRLQQDAAAAAGQPDDGEPEIVARGVPGDRGRLQPPGREAVLLRLAPTALAFVGARRFAAVIEAVEAGDADFAMLPIENTTSGGINEVYDLLLHTRLAIVGEVKLRVDHCLVALGDASSSPSIRARSTRTRRRSRSAARFLAGAAGCTVEYFTDTAEAVAKVRDDGDPTQAAIASEEAARLYGLTVDAQAGIANQKENFTRFLVARAPPRNVDLRIPCKTSLVMATAQKPGALVEALLVFRDARHQPHQARVAADPRQPLGGDVLRRLRGQRRRASACRARSTSSPAARGSSRCWAATRRRTCRRPSRRRGRSRDARGGAEPPRPRSAGAAGPAAAAASSRRAIGWSAATTSARTRSIEVQGRAGSAATRFMVIAGPCAVESREQIIGVRAARARARRPAAARRLLQAAHLALQLPGAGLRGARAAGRGGRARTACPIVTEVLSPADVEAVARASRHPADRRPQHAELRAAARGRARRRGRCCSSAA